MKPKGLLFLLLLVTQLSVAQTRKYYSHGGIVRADKEDPYIYLVFTGGDFNDGTKSIRKTLFRTGVKASFFFTGDFYRKKENQKSIARLKREGHYLGAHSDKHLLYASWIDRDSLLVSKEEFIQDLEANYTEMQRFGIQREDALYFMPPYEWYNDTISAWTSSMGLQLINFTPGTRSNADYTTPDMGKKYVNSQKVMDSIFEYEKTDPHGLNGFILLLHVGTDARRTDKFYYRLEELIDRLRDQGYSFKRL